jgi:two-component system, OmpR family, sensor histidine kinase KdpD
LKVARAEEAFTAITEMIRSALGLRSCRIHRLGAEPDGQAVDALVTWTAEHGHVAFRQVDDTIRLTDSPLLPTERGEDARDLFLPLSVGDRRVGVLELSGDGPLLLIPAHQRYLTALAHYAAVALERARLESEADQVEALREADRLKSALLAAVSHDLRTPLTTIKALAHDLAELDDRALVIEEETDRLNRTVANLLELSRLQAGGAPMKSELNAVDDLLGALAQRVSGILKDRELRMRLVDHGELLIGRFDFVQSLRILSNLVENAHKYAPLETPIEVMGQRNGASIELSVRDYGPGVPPVEVEKIFEPFYRAPGPSPDTGGAGLGLAIARQLARAQGGEIRYQSAPDGGASFVLTLPAADLPTVFSTL